MLDPAAARGGAPPLVSLGSITCRQPGAAHAQGRCNCSHSFRRRLPPVDGLAMLGQTSPTDAISPLAPLPRMRSPPLGAPPSSGPCMAISPLAALPPGRASPSPSSALAISPLAALPKMCSPPSDAPSSSGPCTSISPLGLAALPAGPVLPPGRLVLPGDGELQGALMFGAQVPPRTPRQPSAHG